MNLVKFKKEISKLPVLKYSVKGIMEAIKYKKDMPIDHVYDEIKLNVRNNHDSLMFNIIGDSFWLSPNGNPIYVGAGQHLSFCLWVLNIDESIFENYWVKISQGHFVKNFRSDITKKQQIFLMESGYIS